MRGERWLETPIGPSADRWVTVPARRRVLAVARTVTSTGRLLDVLPVLRDDFRVEVLFTVAGRSAFDDGVHEFLAAMQARLVPWRQVRRTRFDLAISASENGALHQIRAPLLLLPHGAGFHKFVMSGSDSGPAISGLARKQLVRRGRAVPSALALSHPDQLALLEQVCPEVAPRAVVAGDPCYDRITASRRLRERYRRAFGVGDRKLVVLTSTWSTESLLGRHPRLPERLLAELPVDEYAVAAVLHPNVWHGHSRWQTRSWLATAQEAGLILVPPTEGWRAALVAADCVIGDHGSVTFYAATLGVPVLLASDGGGQVVPDTPLAALQSLAPRLDLGRGLRAQLAEAADEPQPARYAGLAAAAFAEPGRSAHLLRDLMYHLMDLTPPSRPPRTDPVPVPSTRLPAVTAFQVFTEVQDAPTPVVRLHRFAAVLDDDTDRGTGLRRQHLAVDLDEPDERLLESASVLFRRDVDERDWARGADAEEIFRRYPGCRVVAGVDDAHRCLLRLRDGTSLLTFIHNGRSSWSVPGEALASAVHAWVAGGRSPNDLGPEFRLRLGPAEVSVVLASSP
ncbi:hypothetical protein [Streptoalloteichus hindustanus]|uniref:CDP-Glycerol:Poly(Glycerophosphate) glycerophosphotransferase n=1 Tax=Streptoalloteichus hindustanus TaxID=2017 RepID=A0A1M5Q870_STRHI|nr:hypothetical protein [Streptoalloteichus hindustanus]SHH09663.1 hypothetical protein SAMN05444320_12211 [Streptoalloteichus hindustanus]